MRTKILIDGPGPGKKGTRLSDAELPRFRGGTTGGGTSSGGNWDHATTAADNVRAQPRPGVQGRGLRNLARLDTMQNETHVRNLACPHSETSSGGGTSSWNREATRRTQPTDK